MKVSWPLISQVGVQVKVYADNPVTLVVFILPLPTVHCTSLPPVGKVTYEDGAYGTPTPLNSVLVTLLPQTAVMRWIANDRVAVNAAAVVVLLDS